MKTLIINTYAGSLLLGAGEIKDAQIIGSFEDGGFGTWVTKANRERLKELDPTFEFVDHIKHWPDCDLTQTNVIAHPPCAAFSNQNRSANKRGTDTDAFGCTVKVLKYAMTNGAASISVESVMGALAGAWDVYENMAEAGGYYVYRILQNALLFGVPQYRERCWHVLIRKDLAPDTMRWKLSPIFQTMSATVDPLLPGTPIDKPERLDKYVRHLTTGPCICVPGMPIIHGFDEQLVRDTVLSHLTGHRRLGFGARCAPFFPQEDPKAICRKHISRFTSGQPSILAESSWAPVLLGTSFWIYRGQPLPLEGYKAIMGFPVDYVIPEEHNYGVRTMLSKGVVPAVATWILANVRNHLGVPTESRFTQDGGYVKEVAAGRIASFRPGRQSILDKLEVMDKHGVFEDTDTIDLRDEEEALEG